MTSTYAEDCSGQMTTTLQQTMWPDHCVKGTEDANIRGDLHTEDGDVVVQKGYNCQVRLLCTNKLSYTKVITVLV